MLDMGFQDDIEKIYNQIPQKVQNMLFSATLPNWIHKISKQYIGEDRILVDLVKKQDNQTAIQVEHLALQSELDNVYSILPLLLQHYLTQQDSKCIIFCETKLQANAISINAKLNMSTAALHGDISQSQREQVIRGLNNDKIKCLIATNVAARGLDLPQIDLIIQLSPPKDVESFIHRSGRTARAGKSGVCITVYQKSDVQKMFQIEREAKLKFKYIGLPQNHNIIEQQIEKIQQQFELINQNDLDVFLEPAKIILNKYNPEQAIQRLMKIATGINKSQQYFSLQNGQIERITMKINQNQTVLLETIKANLDRIFQAYHIRIIDDYTIFDIKSQYLQQFMDLNSSNPKIKIEVLKQLPENYRPQEEAYCKFQYLKDNSDFRNNRRDSSNERGNFQSRNSRDNSYGNRYQQRDYSDGNRYQGRTNNYEGRTNNYEGRTNNYEGRTNNYEGRNNKYEGRNNNQENRFQKQRNNDNEYVAKD